jgi:hypothetical protein
MCVTDRAKRDHARVPSAPSIVRWTDHALVKADRGEGTAARVLTLWRRR